MATEVAPIETIMPVPTEEPLIVPTPTKTWRQWEPEDFPFVSQLGEGAEYKDDCASASILMLAKYYEVAGEETVYELHNELAGGDYPVNYERVVSFLYEKYGLEAKVISTYEPSIQVLEEAGFDVSGIELVKDIPYDKPVIWIYTYIPHWIVRYRGFSFDPFNGIFLFGMTNLKLEVPYPELGLGIVIIKGDSYE